MLGGVDTTYRRHTPQPDARPRCRERRDPPVLPAPERTTGTSGGCTSPRTTDCFVHQRGEVFPCLDDGLHQVVAVFLEVVTLPEPADRRSCVCEGRPPDGILIWMIGTPLWGEGLPVALQFRSDSANQVVSIRETHPLAMPLQSYVGVPPASPCRAVGVKSHSSTRECVFSSRALPTIARKSDGPVIHRPSETRRSWRRRISDIVLCQSARRAFVGRAEVSAHARSIARNCACHERTRSTGAT